MVVREAKFDFLFCTNLPGKSVLKFLDIPRKLEVVKVKVT